MTIDAATGRLPSTETDFRASRTEIGSVRRRNEDAVLLRPWPGAEDVTLAAIADGMGSYGGGDTAAAITIEEFGKLLASPPPAGKLQRCEALLSAFYGADERIRAEADRFPEMGATVVAAILSPGELVHLYAGDCRLYHIHRGKIAYRTRDHSAVQVLVDSGKISAEQARAHPMRNMVTSCLGGPNTVARLTIDPHSWFEPSSRAGRADSPYRHMEAGDIVILCSDGLWGAIGDARLTAAARRFADPRHLVQHCVSQALSDDGSDNVSMIAVAARAPESGPKTGRMEGKHGRGTANGAR